MRIIWLSVLLLAACDSTTPAVAKWSLSTVAVQDMTFGVHWTTDRAEAYRTSRHLRPDLAAVMARAVVAIEQASGCTVDLRSLSGDQAIVKARIRCPSG